MNAKLIISMMLLLALVLASIATIAANPAWSKETVDSAGYVGLYTSIALDASGYPHISYCDCTNMDLKYAKWTGGAWSIETVDSAGDVGGDTSIALDASGYPHISYFDGTNGDLKYAAKWTATAWSKETVDSDGNVGRYTSIALDASGYPHISYFDDTNYDLKYAKWTGSAWSKETVDSAGDVGWYTSIALDASGYPHICYLDWTNMDLKYAKWTGSAWSKETVDSAGNVGWDTSIAIGASGYPHISYYDFTNGDLKYAAKWTATAWSKETVDSAGYVGGDTSIALDASGYPHISYYDYTNDDLKYAKWTGGAWSIETVDSAGYVGGDTSIALDASDYPHISYCDCTNMDLKYATEARQKREIKVTKEGNVTAGAPCTNVNYTITVNNTGDCDLNVTAVDTLPANMSYVGSSPEAESHDGTIRWNIGIVAANDSATVFLVAHIEEGASGLLNNTVHVEGKPEHGDNVTDDAYFEITALVPPNITSFAPPSPVNNTVCNWRTFNISIDQTVNVSWYLNNTLQHTNESTKEANYSLHAEVVGEHNVSAIASNANGSDMQTWIWNVTKAADLVITAKWLCWPDNCTICYNVTNIGNGTAPSCHNTALYVDGVAVAYDHVPVDLAPGESYIGCFDDYTWTYTSPGDNITVCADNNDTLNESDETNNCLTNIWMCGDVNCDGKVTMSDVRKVFNRYLDPNYPLYLPWAADVNCDGKVSMSDVRKVFNRYLEPGYELNCCCES